MGMVICGIWAAYNEHGPSHPDTAYASYSHIMDYDFKIIDYCTCDGFFIIVSDQWSCITINNNTELKSIFVILMFQNACIFEKVWCHAFSVGVKGF